MRNQTYHITYAREDGEWVIVRTFAAMHDHHAMQSWREKTFFTILDTVCR